ncbi:hypothetical protein BOTBODRAFT_107948 [Botryobasidium botryosum FD-172 SS1]|uniref:MBOAT-domain-containing protein n=1 Tax=Botryobasidium botryosum (strain FD-172 SS1) TaxID=930990 RepID=A0A067MJC2_BOTB1|nr:hypothetical protein BOTBODRAFT_107948 [Botryobasidium botryosum FD-172 SS1]
MIPLSAEPPSTSQPPGRRKGLINLTVETPPSTSRKNDRPKSRRPASRWKTPEFIFYAIAFILVVPHMFTLPMNLSQTTHPNYPLYQHRLSRGWIPGREVDNSDGQYRGFRNNIPALFALATVFLVLGKLHSWIFAPKMQSISRRTELFRVSFLAVASVVVVTALHGASVLKIFAILLINYSIAKLSPQSPNSIVGPLLTWAFNMVMLFSNELNDGYKFGRLHSSLAVLDSMQGIHPRWHIGFNITMLRLVSFNMDYFWACRGVGTPDTGANLDQSRRASTSHEKSMYNFTNYLTYILYTPLYIAGPIMTFNDFLWQIRRPTAIPLRSTVMYLVRFIVCLLTMELVLHYMYVVAIKDAVAWMGDSPAELSMVGFWNLIVVWLKLLIPWRFFRLWALADGIDPPENMIRCVTNNYSALGFWRSWHRSYNLWTLRYVYVPIGGTTHPVLSRLLVFSFVALWHDLSFRLLAWGWLVCLFIVPELLASYFLPQEKYGDRPWYRHVCAIGGVGNIMMMMSANLVGFVIGTDGIKYFLGQLGGSWEGIRFVLFAVVCLFIGVQVMFEYREEEMRAGIYRKC